MYRKGRQAIMGPFSTSFSHSLNFCHAAPAKEETGKGALLQTAFVTA